MGARRLIDVAGLGDGLAFRYLAVSILNVVNHQILLNLANSGWGWGGGVSNLFAAVIAAIPAYFITRYWVWNVRGSHSVRAEILPFWILSLAGLVISSGLAEGADRLFGAGLAVAMASMFGYFIVWVGKFVILDRLFAARRAAQESPIPPDALDEAPVNP